MLAMSVERLNLLDLVENKLTSDEVMERILFISSINWLWTSNIFEFVSNEWADIMIKIFLSFTIQGGGFRTRSEKDLISLVISKTLVFLVFNKLNSV